MIVTSASLFCQNNDDDTTPPVDSSGIFSDSTLYPTDSIKSYKSIPAKDTVQYTKYSFLDTITVYLLPDRLNHEEDIAKSFNHDPADFIKFNTSGFIQENELTPMRKTVSAFGLPGNRTDVILNGRSLNPVEHIIRPDNLIDLNDVPTTPVQSVYSADGPVGMIFGEGNATSSVILLPVAPEGPQAESRMVVDKGSSGYANTRAVFSQKGKNGKLVRAALEYRKADGLVRYREDDAYHQWGELIFPINTKSRVTLGGRLYRRIGSYPIWPDSTYDNLGQSRRDRDLSAGFEIDHSFGGTSRILFRHQRSESRLDDRINLYFRNLDIFDNTLSIEHTRPIGSLGFRTGLEITQYDFHDGPTDRRRRRAKFHGSLIRGSRISSWAATFAYEKVGGFEPEPSGAILLTFNGDKFYLSSSIGYSTKFPRQYELDLVPLAERLINPNNVDYYESGNPDLLPEKQLVGNLSLGIGKAGADFLLSITAGKIIDGIDWEISLLDTLGSTVDAYKAVNNDLEFINITGRQKIMIGEILYWSGGASYRQLKVDKDDNPPYAPEYQAFSNLQIYQYVKFLELHLYGYLEAVYNGPFKTRPAFGIAEYEIENDTILNLKLSFRIKKFRFYYVFQNLLDTEYSLRDGYVIPGRFNYYGLTWDFLD
jgi:hypothetical protein